MNRKGTYAGSFDPITWGHLDIIMQASELFDELIIAVGNNSAKTPMFTVEQRIKQIESAVQSELRLPCLVPESCKITVCSFDGMLVDFAKRENIPFVVRGLRDHIDFAYESHVARANHALSSTDDARPLQTVWFYANQETAFISSSLIRDMIRLKADTSEFSPID